MTENNIKTLTDAYLISYMRAMEKTKNPNIAVGAAMAICTVLGNQMQNDAQRAAEQNPIGALMAAILNGAAGKEEGADDEPEPGE